MLKTNPLAGKLFLCMIGLMLITAGGVFEWLMIRSYRQAKATREWTQTEAVILRSVIDERRINGSPIEFRLNVLYGYSFQKENLTSSRLSPRGAKWSKDAAAVKKLANKYPEGSVHMAWVNPTQPSQAILIHDTTAAGYSLWFPGIIIIGGIGMVWGAFWGPQNSASKEN